MLKQKKHPRTQCILDKNCIVDSSSVIKIQERK